MRPLAHRPMQAFLYNMVLHIRTGQEYTRRERERHRWTERVLPPVYPVPFGRVPDHRPACPCPPWRASMTTAQVLVRRHIMAMVCGSTRRVAQHRAKGPRSTTQQFRFGTRVGGAVLQGVCRQSVTTHTHHDRWLLGALGTSQAQACVGVRGRTVCCARAARKGGRF